jgi:histidinol phosphatase-like enzyme (inositol monophosphatase family)
MKNDFLNFALDAVWQAGRITLSHFQTGVPVERKADNSPLTIADQQAEQLLRRLIAEHWPEHGIIGEEYGRSPTNSPYTWVIDPIDGTKSFISGVPFYANLLALLEGDEAILGISNFPALNEMIYGLKGGGAFFNGRPARVSAVAKLEDARLLTSELNYFRPTGKQAAWERLCQATYFQRTWGDAYGYALVATGRAEIMVDAGMYLWDCAPWQVILEEAGGTFTDWQGQATIHGGNSIATNGHLFEPVMSLVKG